MAQKPLSGLRILVGRARRQASALSSGLRALGAEVIEIPFIEIRRPRSYKALDRALGNLARYDWLVLTSVNGVEALWSRLRALRLSKRQLSHLKIAAIGPATRAAIESRGLQVQVVPKEYVAESVVKSLRRHVKGKAMLLARARVARDVIPRALREAGARVDVAEAYETVVPNTSRKLLRTILEDPRRRPHVITFTSSSSARNFVELLRVRGRIARGHTVSLRGIRFASIGPVTSSTLRELGLPVHVQAREFTIPGLIRALVESR
jgi:uroporphyrinogen-III synthase